MSVLSNLMGNTGVDFAIDLGTANTLVATREAGILINEPSMVAVDTDAKRIVAVGAEAKRMLGRTPGNIAAVRPLHDGVVAEFDVTQAMLGYFMNKARGGKRQFMAPRPRVVIGVPCGVTGVEKRALYEATMAAGARSVTLIEEPMAAALGADLPVEEPTGSMIVDIGGGSAEVAIISMGSIVSCRSVRVGGDAFDTAILEHVHDYYGLNISERTAEILKIRIGSAAPLEHELDVEVNGRDSVNGLPRTVRVESEEIRRALDAPVNQVVKAVRHVLDDTPPDLASDLMYYGILLSGGGGLLRSLDRRIATETGIPVNVSPTALENVVVGCNRVLGAGVNVRTMSR